jgi:hypothetical protein
VQEGLLSKPQDSRDLLLSHPGLPKMEALKKDTVHDTYFAGLMLEDSTTPKYVPSSKESRAYFSKLMALQF